MRKLVVIPALVAILGAGCGSSDEEAATPTTCRMYEITLARALVDRSQAHLADDLDPDTVAAVADWWEKYEAKKIQLRNQLGWTPRSSSSTYPELDPTGRELDQRMAVWAKGEVTDILVEEAYAAGDCIR